MLEKVKEKLKTDNQVEEAIANHLISFCEKEISFADKILNEKKSLAECMEYIKFEARKQAIGNAAVIDRDTVFGWAVHYFDEEDLEFDKVYAQVGTIGKSKSNSKVASKNKAHELKFKKDLKPKNINLKQKNNLGEQLSFELF